MRSQLCRVRLIPESCRVHCTSLTPTRLDRLILDRVLLDPVMAAHAVRPLIRRLIILVDKLPSEPQLICITV